MKFGRLRFGCLALGVACALGSASVPAADSCFGRMLRERLKDRETENSRWAWRAAAQAAKAFDAEAFAKAKARYAAHVPTEAFDVPTSFEERLAFFEVTSHGFLKIEDHLANEKVLQEYFRILKPNMSLSEAKLREAVDLLYLAPRTEQEKFGLFFKQNAQALGTRVQRLKRAERDLIFQRIVNDVTAHNAAEILGPTGLLRDEKAFEKFGPYGKYHDVQEGAMTVILNAPVAMLPGFYGVVPPAFNFLNRRRTPPALIEKAMLEGIDSIYEEMKALYGNEARFDFYWEWARKTWAGVFTGLYLMERQRIYEQEDRDEAQAKKLEEVQMKLARQMVRKKIEESTYVDFNERLLARWELTYRKWYAKEYGKDFSQASPSDLALHDRLRKQQIKQLYAK